MDRSSAQDAASAVTRAVRRRAAADAALVETMHAADQAGVARNEICRRVAGTYSRQTAMDLLNAASLRERVVEVLTNAGIRVEGDTAHNGGGRVAVERRRSRIQVRLVTAEGSPDVDQFAAGVHEALLAGGVDFPSSDAEPDPVEALARGEVTEVEYDAP